MIFFFEVRIWTENVSRSISHECLGRGIIVGDLELEHCDELNCSMNKLQDIKTREVTAHSCYTAPQRRNSAS